MDDISHALVTQHQSLSYRSRGYVFIKGRPTPVKNKDDIKHFQDSSIFTVNLVKIVRKKATAKKAAAPKPKPKAEKRGLFGGKKKTKKK